MLLQITEDAGLLTQWPQDSVQAMQRHAKAWEKAETLYAVKRFSETIPQLKGGYQPQLPLELALIEVANGQPAPLVQEGGLCKRLPPRQQQLQRRRRHRRHSLQSRTASQLWRNPRLRHSMRNRLHQQSRPKTNRRRWTRTR